jgi:hypothetical protein
LASEGSNANQLFDGVNDNTNSNSNSRNGDKGGKLHGVMLGRAVVARPWHLMSNVDQHMYNGIVNSDNDPALAQPPPLTRRVVLEQ